MNDNQANDFVNRLNTITPGWLCARDEFRLQIGASQSYLAVKKSMRLINIFSLWNVHIVNLFSQIERRFFSECTLSFPNSERKDRAAVRVQVKLSCGGNRNKGVVIDVLRKMCEVLRSGGFELGAVLNWNAIEFCGEDVINPVDVVGLLTGEGHIFPDSLWGIFLRRYQKMKENFLLPIEGGEIWRQGGFDWDDKTETWENGLSLAVTNEYKDAILQIGLGKFCGDSIWDGPNGILSYPCVGHDLPVWMKKNDCDFNKKVMIISQDPLRTGHGTGKLLVSSPFGFHSADYRDNSTMMKLVHRLLQEGAVVYLTDFMKIYNRHKNDTGSDGWCKCKDCTDKKGEKHVVCCSFLSEDKKGCCGIKDWKDVLEKKKQVQDAFRGLYKKTLDNEIKIFNPNIILVLGQDASIAMFPEQHFDREENGKKFNDRVLPNPLVELSYDGIKCMICHHPSNLPVKGPVEYYLNPLREMLKIKGV